MKKLTSVCWIEHGDSIVSHIRQPGGLTISRRRKLNKVVKAKGILYLLVTPYQLSLFRIANDPYLSSQCNFIVSSFFMYIGTDDIQSP